MGPIDDSIFPANREEVCRIIRKIVRDRLQMGLPEDALFFAQKLYDLTFDDCKESDFELLIQTLYLNKDYENLASFVQQRPEFKNRPKFVIYLARSLIKCQKYKKALTVLRDFENPPDLSGNYSLLNEANDHCSKFERAQLLVMYGKIKAAESERESASTCFQEALKIDKWSAEAFQALAELEKHPMPNSKENAGGEFSCACNRVVESMYYPLINGTDSANAANCDFVVGKLFNLSKVEITWSAKNTLDFSDEHNKNFDSLFSESVSRLLVVATECFEYFDLDGCLNACKEIRRRDPLNRRCIILQTACLACIEDDERTELFLLANELTIAIPNTAIAWYVSAVYDYCLAKDGDKSQAFARKFFAKATDIEPRFVEAWIGLGHALARDNEHDQAIDMYYKAAKLDQWDYRPIYFIGVEYSDSRHFDLADKFLSEAVALCTKQNSLHLANRVLNDYGCLKFRAGDYKQALKIFRSALETTQTFSRQMVRNRSHITDISQKQFRSYFHVVHVNLAHTHAQLNNFVKSLEHHVQALQMVPHDVDVLLSIATICIEFGLCRQAFEFLHDAGSIDPDITNATQFTQLHKLIYMGEEMDPRIFRNCPAYDRLSTQQFQGTTPLQFFSDLKLCFPPAKLLRDGYKAKWLQNDEEHGENIASVLTSVGDIGIGYVRTNTVNDEIDVDETGDKK